MTLGLLSSFSFAAERPPYESLAKDGNFELRLYPRLTLVSTPMARMDGGDGSFNRLFRYISGSNADSAKIPMTAPVLLDETGQRMNFILPEKMTLEQAPAPTATDVSTSEIAQVKVATLRFSKLQSKAHREEAERALRAWVRERGLVAMGAAVFAGYDAPWTPEWLRTNEVWLRVEQRPPSPEASPEASAPANRP